MALTFVDGELLLVVGGLLDNKVVLEGGGGLLGNDLLGRGLLGDSLLHGLGGLLRWLLEEESSELGAGSSLGLGDGSETLDTGDGSDEKKSDLGLGEHFEVFLLKSFEVLVL